MSGQVIDFARAAARLPRRSAAARSAGTSAAARFPHQFKFWTGASGKRYVHTQHGLIDCPEVDACNVMLVRRTPAGRREILHVGRLEHDAPSLNLAEIRRLGATLGANEVYLHLLAETAQQRRFVELDLSAAAEHGVSDRAARG